MAQRAALAAVAGDLSAVAEMRGHVRPATPAVIWELLSSIDGVVLPRARGRLLRLPQPRGAAGPRYGGRRPTNTLELADIALEQAKVAFVPGEAFGAPGYARFSFALGDDDLGEGIRRIADLFADRADVARDDHRRRSAPGRRPITADRVVEASVRLGDVHVSGSRTRPRPCGGPSGVRARAVAPRSCAAVADGDLADVLPAGSSASTSVHEYGGGAWWLAGETVFFVQRRRPADLAARSGLRPDGRSRPSRICPQACATRTASMTPDWRWIICVQEVHPASDAIPATGPRR